jgi:hypothetical protein
VTATGDRCGRFHSLEPYCAFVCCTRTATVRTLLSMTDVLSLINYQVASGTTQETRSRSVCDLQETIEALHFPTENLHAVLSEHMIEA